MAQAKARLDEQCVVSGCPESRSAQAHLSRHPTTHRDPICPIPQTPSFAPQLLFLGQHWIGQELDGAEVFHVGELNSAHVQAITAAASWTVVVDLEPLLFQRYQLRDFSPDV